ncbi:pseudouridine synthase [Astrobacterium formosum]|uniref:pseudouridine synthase n=1 Tax=Astrobacterium formosum TaxID=3069710 RepID=UPI003F4F7993
MASEDPPRNHPARSDRPRVRPKGGKPFSGKPFGDKPHGGKPRGDKPYGGKPRGDKPYGDKPRGDRPYGGKPRGDRPYGDKPRGDRPYGDKPRGDRPYGDKPRGDRPYGDKPRGDRPYGDKPRGDRPYGDKPRGDRPYGDKPRGDRPYGDKPRGDRPYGDKPRGDRPYGDKPRGDRPYGGKPYGGGPQGGKPYRGKPWRDRAAQEPSQHEGDRIAKVMARAGVCSRRDAEDWIAAGRVMVNGAVITSPALNIGPRDRVSVDGAPLPERERTRLFLYHKPQGLVTTNADPEGRPTIFENLPKNLPRLVTIGRLDIGTEGLLLLTNDGGLARVLELPDTAWLRRYRVRAMGSVTQPDLDALRDGITVEGIQYGPIEATLDREQGSNVWITFAIREGKNREVRNVLGHLGLAVNRLIRVSYGPFQLGELAEGEVEEVRTRVLREQLGERVIDEAECDFSAQIVQRPETATLAPPPDRDKRERPERRGDDRPRGDDRSRGDYQSRGDYRSRGDDRPRRDDRSRGDYDKPIRRDHRGDATPEDQGRPRRGHSWRADDAPVRRHYRGERKEKFQPDLASTEKRASLLQDRKGRNVLVERIGAPKPEPREDKPKRAYGKRPDRPHGKRFDRPGGERSDRPRDDRPFRRDDRAGGPGGKRFDKPRGERFDRPEGDRPFRRDDRPGGKRFDKPGGKRFDKPQGPRPFKGRPRRPDRSGGPRPTRPR